MLISLSVRTAAKPAVNDRVAARFGNNEWYTGTVTRSGPTKVTVTFDDGETKSFTDWSSKVVKPIASKKKRKTSLTNAEVATLVGGSKPATPARAPVKPTRGAKKEAAPAAPVKPTRGAKKEAAAPAVPAKGKNASKIAALQAQIEEQTKSNIAFEKKRRSGEIVDAERASRARIKKLRALQAKLDALQPQAPSAPVKPARSAKKETAAPAATPKPARGAKKDAADQTVKVGKAVMSKAVRDKRIALLQKKLKIEQAAARELQKAYKKTEDKKKAAGIDVLPKARWKTPYIAKIKTGMDAITQLIEQIKALGGKITQDESQLGPNKDDTDAADHDYRNGLTGDDAIASPEVKKRVSKNDKK